MPKASVTQRARKKAREGKAPTTQAGEFVREEMHQLGRSERAPKSKKQAVAIGLSKARKAGVKVPPKRKTKRTLH